MILLICGIWKIDTNEFIHKEKRLSGIKNKFWLPKGKEGMDEGIN